MSSSLEERAKKIKCGPRDVLVTNPGIFDRNGEAVLITIPMTHLNLYEKRGYIRFIPAPSEAKEPKEAKKYNKDI